VRTLNELLRYWLNCNLNDDSCPHLCISYSMSLPNVFASNGNFSDHPLSIFGWYFMRQPHLLNDDNIWVESSFLTLTIKCLIFIINS
jgi:hypothetical protein